MDKLKGYINYIDKLLLLAFLFAFSLSAGLMLNALLDFKAFKIPDTKITPNGKKLVKKEDSLRGLEYLFPKINTTKKTVETEEAKIKEVKEISNIQLKGTIQVGRLRTAIVKYNGKLYTVKIGDKIGDYKVEYIDDFYIVVSKGDKEFKIYLSLKSTGSPKKTVSREKKEDKPKKVVKVNRRDIKKNLKTAFKDIIAIPALRSGKMIGWRILKVKEGSIFDKYGLRRGDIIVSINGKPANEITSISDFYKIIKDTKNINLEVKRGKEVVEVFIEIE